MSGTGSEGLIHKTSKGFLASFKVIEGNEDDREGTLPLTKELLESHISALILLIKDHNKLNIFDPIRLNFELEDTKVGSGEIMKGKRVGDANLKRPFKEALRIPHTRRIIEFTGPEYKMLTNIKLYDGTTDLEDHLNRFASSANFEEWPMPVWCRMLQQNLNGYARGWFERLLANSINEWSELKEAFVISFPRAKLVSILKDHSFWRPEGMIVPTRITMEERLEEMTTKITSGEGITTEKGHHTNDCIQLKKQLEMALESEKLNHLVKDVRQRGRGNQRGEAQQQAKVINMIRTRPVKEKKRKTREATEVWMNTALTFPLVSAKDVLEEPLSIEAEVEGYLVIQVYMDKGASIEVMFEHFFKNLSLAIKARLRETQTYLVGFAKEVTKPLGKIELEVCFGSEGLYRRTTMKFAVIRAPSPYNVIHGIQDYNSTPKSLEEFYTVLGDGIIILSDDVISYKRLCQEPQDGIRTMDSFQGLNPRSPSSWHRPLAPSLNLELKRRYLNITVLTTNTLYPSRKIRCICGYTSLKTKKETKSNTPYPRSPSSWHGSFLSGRIAKLRNDILMFQQHQGESLSKAWTHFKDLIQEVPHHGIDLWL
ncbi:hypothetical protein Tco_0480524 [Tanacetum coccineum]